ncbi:hypothetical protein [Haliscomenobacter sp.]|uniref:hypothetical protein n=1 Tax=Haliscomenobacter sp. TaxID=2717303 RepID=UPI003364EF4F
MFRKYADSINLYTFVLIALISIVVSRAFAWPKTNDLNDVLTISVMLHLFCLTQYYLVTIKEGNPFKYYGALRNLPYSNLSLAIKDCQSYLFSKNLLIVVASFLITLVSCEGTWMIYAFAGIMILLNQVFLVFIVIFLKIKILKRQSDQEKFSAFYFIIIASIILASLLCKKIGTGFIGSLLLYSPFTLIPHICFIPSHTGLFFILFSELFYIGLILLLIKQTQHA